MKRKYIFLVFSVCSFLFFACELIDSLVANTAPALKQIKESDLKGKTVTWLIFAEDDNPARSFAYKKAAAYFSEKSKEAGFQNFLQVIVVSDAVEKIIKEKVRQAGFDADCFPLKYNGAIKEKYNPGSKQNYSVFFNKDGEHLFSLNAEGKIENFNGIKNYAKKITGIDDFSSPKNILKIPAAVNKVKNDEIFNFMYSAAGYGASDIIAIFKQ